MRTPSIKTLSRVFENPTHAKLILQMSHGELSAHPVGAARIAECYHPPKWYDVRLTVLASIDPGLFGVECLEGRTGRAHYLIVGDVYNDTLIFWGGNYRIQSVADFDRGFNHAR